MNRILPIFTCFILFLLAYACTKKIADSGRLAQEQFENIRIDQEFGVQTGPCEPSIFINPTNKDQIVAGAVLDRVYTSQDGGKTWSTGRLESSLGVWGDPVIVADYNGAFLLLAPFGSLRTKLGT